MNTILDFLRDVRVHNDRVWFNENKERYKDAQARFHEIAERVIHGIAGFDPSVGSLTLRDCTYRFYRDTRFSANKDPYKTHFGLYVCPKGKKSGYAGYYFHIEPTAEDGSGGSFITTGLYGPEKNILNSVRDDIHDNGEQFLATIKKAKGFRLDTSNTLKKLPAGYQSGKYDQYIKLKDIYISKPLTEDYLLGRSLAQRIVEDFSKTFPFCALLNRSVDYAYETGNQ